MQMNNAKPAETIGAKCNEKMMAIGMT